MHTQHLMTAGTIYTSLTSLITRLFITHRACLSPKASTVWKYNLPLFVMHKLLDMWDTWYRIHTKFSGVFLWFSTMVRKKLQNSGSCLHYLHQCVSAFYALFTCQNNRTLKPAMERISRFDGTINKITFRICDSCQSFMVLNRNLLYDSIEYVTG